MREYLDFEKPIAELEAKIEELKHVGSDSEVNVRDEIGRLQAKSRQLTRTIFASLTPWQITHSVLLPAAIPEIFTGIRIGFSLTLIGTLLGEMFASQRGLGFLLINAIGLHNIPMIMALTLILVVAAVVASAALLGIERHLHRYA